MNFLFYASNLAKLIAEQNFYQANSCRYLSETLKILLKALTQAKLSSIASLVFYSSA